MAGECICSTPAPAAGHHLPRLDQFHKRSGATNAINDNDFAMGYAYVVNGSVVTGAVPGPPAPVHCSAATDTRIRVGRPAVASAAAERAGFVCTPNDVFDKRSGALYVDQSGCIEGILRA
jgi:hypothetical protein